MFGLFKKKPYPLFSEDMIKPLDEPLPTTDAKKIYRQYMSGIGYLKKEEISDAVYDLSEAMKGEVEDRKATIQGYKEEMKDWKQRLKEEQSKLKKCTAEEREEIQYAIEEMEDNIQGNIEDIEQETRELELFKKDKREFLVNYINDELRHANENR